MAGHPDLPRPKPLLLDKANIFARLKALDQDASASKRILRMESDFRARIGSHLTRLPAGTSKFEKFNTNPFVLLFYSKQQQYGRVAQIERDLVPAKVFSSMETSAGRMIEQVVLPVYGWKHVTSAMQSHQSLLDGERATQSPGTFVGATLKSGPRTLNDDISRNIASGLVTLAPSWAVGHSAQQVDFTYGVLYGTKKQSNKKDWHVLRNIDELRPRQSVVLQSHKKAWSVVYQDGPLTVSATVRIGTEWWEFLGGPDTWLELCCALIRACVAPVAAGHGGAKYSISDLASFLDMSALPSSYNVAVLQKSQLEWLLFLARHLSDGFT